MFDYASEDGYREPLPGIRQKTLVWGEKTLMTEFRLRKGASLPQHSHPHEQTGYLVQGSMTLHIGNERSRLSPGDSWNIPSGVPHHAEIHEDTVAIEVFHPVREEYLPNPEAGMQVR